MFESALSIVGASAARRMQYVRRAAVVSIARAVSSLAMSLMLGVMATAWLVACDRGTESESGGAAQQSGADGAVDASVIHAMNRAVGLMGKFEFTQAEQEFARIAALPNAPLEAELDRAIAVLNQSRDGAQDDALALLGQFLANMSSRGAGPTASRDLSLRARYCQGLCLLYLGRAGEAVTAFLPVAEARGEDAYAQYFLGQSLEQVGEPAKALGWYEKAVARDPMLKSAVLGVQRCARKLNDDARSERALQEFEELARNPRARNAEFKYTRMGKMGLAIVPESDAMASLSGSLPASAPSLWTPKSGELFAEERDLDIRWPAGFEPKWSGDTEQHAITLDLNRDGLQDLLLARAIADPSASGPEALRTLVLIARTDGGFDAVPSHPLATLAGGTVWSLLAGDIDGDGRTDVYACRSGGNRLLLATDDGGFRDATAEWNAAGAMQLCIDGALADLDHDGDLDLYLIAGDGPTDLLANMGNGTFRSIGKEAGVVLEERGSRSVFVGDFDYDRDTDIFVMNTIPPHKVFLNERLWKWKEGRPAGFSEEQMGEEALAAAVVDIADIPLRRLVIAAGGYLRMPTKVKPYTGSPRIELAVADVTGDGHPNIVVLKQGVVGVHDEAGNEIVTVDVAKDAVRTQLMMLDPAKGPSLLSLRVAGVPRVRSTGPAAGPFAALSFSGRDDPSQSMRSNTSGIGTAYAARIGSEWFGGEAFRSHTGLGQSLSPVAIGTGPFDRLDFVEIEWSDGVFQSEIDMKSGEVHRVVETQRQISSCPVVFAWNGERMEFVTDVLGVGGLGYLLEPGVYSEPRPRETFVFPEGALVPRTDGSLRVALAEPMEESCMLDLVSLSAIDVPAGWDIAPDERLAIGGVPPTGDIVAWRTSWLASSANATTRDALAKVDLVAPDVGPHDPRFLGRLAQDQVLELEFATDIHAIADPWIVIDGWVEYPYCQTMFAAWQAGAKYRAPSLEARGADGTWTTLVEEWGYPAGMPRRMALPIPREKVPAGATALRMRTNMEVYFDSVRLVSREALPTSAMDLPMSRAELASVGFARRTTGPQKQPHYDNSNRAPLWDCRFQYGLYTEFGDVAGLVDAGDDALAVFGPGEQISVDFAAPPTPVPTGATRRYVLEVRGWCKDMDLFTKDGETIEPVPGAKPALMEKLRTRPMGGR
jgi:tetratricopeptide (TPR) repeat protein